jgi:hypothetical protein
MARVTRDSGSLTTAVRYVLTYSRGTIDTCPECSISATHPGGRARATAESSGPTSEAKRRPAGDGVLSGVGGTA